MWRDKYGCASDPTAANVWSSGDGITSCDSLCAKRGLLELCMMKGIGHQLDVPTLGYPFTAAWWGGGRGRFRAEGELRGL
jgi:poly(3-hydroxybutyrate) depolymerase